MVVLRASKPFKESGDGENGVNGAVPGLCVRFEASMTKPGRVELISGVLLVPSIRLGEWFVGMLASRVSGCRLMRC